MKSFNKKSLQIAKITKRITKFIAITIIKTIAKQIIITCLFSSAPSQYLEPLPVEVVLTEIEQKANVGIIVGIEQR